MRYYVGHRADAKVVFQASTPPTATEYPEYAAVVGPFHTKRAALWAASQHNNPHYQTVADAERLSRHDFQAGRFTGTVTCSRCGLLPLDREDSLSPCDGVRP